MTFLPKEYAVPNPQSNYFKLQKGENRFRILDKPIMGEEYWIDEGEKRKPVRVRPNTPINISDVPEPDKIKHFWAMPVYNYELNQVQILEITQRTIQKEITKLSRDKDWGDPVGYDILVTRTGDGMETEYSVTPKPHKPLEKELLEQYKQMSINLAALYDGKDPFEIKASDPSNVDGINLDDLPL